MIVSVALCTYNGAHYLREQLDSIAAQTRPPDEIVIRDDASQDQTLDIAREFAQRVSFHVRILRNPDNLGSTRNFGMAIADCRGDIIVLSDQDDVWHPNKLEMIIAEFASHPKVGLVFSDAEVVDEDLKPLGTRLWPYAKFTPSKQQRMRRGEAFRLLLRYNHVTGATMAFAARLKEIVLPIPENIGIIHDGWISLMAAAVADVAFTEQPLILYRQHPQQQMGTRPGARPQVLARSHYEAHLHQLEVVSERLSSYADAHPDIKAGPDLTRLAQQQRHLRTRLNLPPTVGKRIPSILREMVSLGYHRYSNGWKSAVRDLL